MSSPIQRFLGLAWLLALVCTCTAERAEAGVFNIPHFVPEGEFALGVEPELVLGDDSGGGVNAKYTQGFSNLINAQAIVGTGGGPRRFRAGGNLVVDIFPDLAKQPGIGFATQALYVRGPENGQMEITLIPYIHKSFVNAPREKSAGSSRKPSARSKPAKVEDEEEAEAEKAEGTEIDPFIAFPFGYSFSNGNYKPISSFAAGALFKASDHFSFVFEFDMPINNTQTTVSGGLVYYH